jgi:uncharacterized protein YoxC
VSDLKALIEELQVLVYDLEATFVAVRGVPATSVADVNRTAARLQSVVDRLKEEQ